MKNADPNNERRHYLRLDSVFPVQFRLVSLDGKKFFSDWLQGFTHNISKGGLQLEANNLKPESVSLLKNGRAAVFLQIQIPLSRPMVNAQAKVAWIKESEEENKCSIGLAYEQINAVGEKRIMRYVWMKIMFLPIVLTAILALGAGFSINGYLSLKLIKGNRALVGQLIKILQDSNVAKQKIKEISREKEDRQLKIDALQLRIKAVEEEKSGLAEKAKAEETKSASSVKELNVVVEKLTREKNALQEQLIGLQHKESAVTEELLNLGQKKSILAKANFDKIYRWLAARQNRHTGLVTSFDGPGEGAGLAFTYDQSLALQVYINFSDFERAKAMLDFFSRKAKKAGGFFVNAYRYDDGSPAVPEASYGPNIWMGIAVCQYTKKSGEDKYLRLAEEIAQSIMKPQAQDKDGGLRGGLGMEWYSTEDNLDGYAFLNMLYEITGKQVYSDGRDKIINWLNTHAYDKADNSVQRVKGGSTIISNTYVWAIAAIGPEKLSGMGLNPDNIVEQAENNCAVEADFIRPDGENVKIKGFDFSAKSRAAGVGVASSEFTAQMILIYKIIGDYYHTQGMPNKGITYEDKADEYMSSLCNMIISIPSASSQGEGCLPFASADLADTGHGWIVSKGNSTGSVSGTAYTLFAYHKYNPLRLKD